MGISTNIASRCDTGVYLESLCDTGVCLVCGVDSDGVTYALRLMPAEVPFYRVFQYNKTGWQPFTSKIFSRSEAVTVYGQLIHT